jgi:nitroreductase
MPEFDSVVHERRSIRLYSPAPVPEDVIREVISDACWAPSWGNTQCTSVYVLSGAALDGLKSRLHEVEAQAHPGRPDIEMPGPGTWPEPYRSRTAAFARSRTAFCAEEERKCVIASPEGGEDDEPSAPAAAPALFGAPHLLLLCTARGVSVSVACLDTGAFSQTLALAAHSRGLGTCFMAGVVRHPDLLREAVPGGEALVFVMAMTLGYPDAEAPINRFPRQRVALEERAFFIGS